MITTILDINTYPTGNTASFVYSGIYMNYTLVNQNTPLQQAVYPTGSNALTPSDGLQNYNYFSLLRAQYQIFGLSAFQINSLPSNVTVVNYQLSFPDINTVILQSDDVNYITNIRVSSDRWNSLISSCSANTQNMLNIKQKLLTSVPSIQVGQQSIVESSSALNFLYRAAPIGTSSSPLSASITFTNSLYFENITAGMAYSLQFTFKLPAHTTINRGYSSSTANNLVQFVISVEGNQIYNKV